MYDLIERVAGHLADRVSGPLHLRLIVQPFASVLLAVLDGVHDAENKRPPYFWSLVTVAGHRREMLKDGWKSICKIFMVALALDAAYQWVELKFFYLGEAILVAFALAIAPYVLVRGVVTRLVGKPRISA
jgi:hypothetical protein